MKKFILVVALGLLATSTYAVGGQGSAVIAPSALTCDSFNKYISITFTAGNTAWVNGTLAITIPSGWASGQTHTSGANNYVHVGITNGTTASVVCNGRAITVTAATLQAVSGKIYVYYDKVTPMGKSNQQFYTRSQSAGSSGLLAISVQPFINLTCNYTPTITKTITPTTGQSQTITPTLSPTVTKTVTQTITLTVTKTVTQTATSVFTKTVTPTITETVTKTVTGTVTQTITPYSTPPFPTNTPTQSGGSTTVETADSVSLKKTYDNLGYFINYTFDDVQVTDTAMMTFTIPIYTHVQNIRISGNVSESGKIYVYEGATIDSYTATVTSRNRNRPLNAQNISGVLFHPDSVTSAAGTCLTPNGQVIGGPGYFRVNSGYYATDALILKELTSYLIVFVPDLDDTDINLIITWDEETQLYN